VVANDTWVAENHIPSFITPYLDSFRAKHGNLFGNAKKKKVKNAEGL